MECYIGVDVGTTAVKAAAVAADGALITSSEVALEMLRPRPEWSEQSPEAWVDATRAAIARLAEAIAGACSGVKAIGFSGQMHALVVLGKNEQPLRNAILWNDNRASEEAEQLNAAAPDLAERLGIPATPSFVAPKWLW